VVVKVVPPGVPFSMEFVLALSSGTDRVVEDRGGTEAASGTAREIDCSCHKPSIKTLSESLSS
jgi:hypothetical protein